MDSDPSSPTSLETHRSRQASRCSSTTIGSSTTSASFELPELETQDQDQGAVQIAGVDKAFEDLDLENGKEEGDDVGSEAGGKKKVIAPETKVKREGEVEEEDEEEEGSEETLNERETGQDTVQDQEGKDKDEDEDDNEVDEDHPVYQYTLALFEYTKRQYMEARWQHERLERDQNRRGGKQAGGKQSGMERMAARKAAMSNKHDHGL